MVSLVGEGHTRVVLDLSRVDFVDSVGLGIIVSALKRVRARGGELVVAGAVPRVRALFELTRLDEIIELHDRVDDAVAAHAGPPGPRGATMGEVVLEIPARPEYVALARQVVAAAAAVEPTFRDERIDDLRIAVSEATTNAIEAHADLSSDERVVIRCDLGPTASRSRSSTAARASTRATSRRCPTRSIPPTSEPSTASASR